MKARGEWTINVRATVQFAAVCILIVAILAFLHRRSREAEWTLVHGTIQETRIIADQALQTKWGGQVTWRADYKVAYAVATREYALWADSTSIRGQSEADVRLALPQVRLRMPRLIQPSRNPRYLSQTADDLPHQEAAG